ncbi:hypothetical protein V8E54_008967 [Elaphomyces granulatus]
MPDSGTLFKVPCANNELKIDTDESDELKIDTFDRLDELLRTVKKHDLAAFRRVHFIYDVDNEDSDIDGLELRTARFLGSLPHLQTLQLDGWASTGRLLQRAIAEAIVTSFKELKTVIWGSHATPLNELLPLWGFSLEHIEVRMAEPVSPIKHWPAPTSSLRRLNLHRSSIADHTVRELLHLSPCLETLRFDHLCNVADPQKWQDCSLLTSALRQVQPTLRELDLSVGLYSDAAEEVDYLEIIPVRGQLGPLREFSRLRKLKTPIVTLLGWSPGALPLRIADVVPAGLTHLGLTEDMAMQCMYEWNKELVLQELEVFLSVWRNATPNLQVVEVWLSRGHSRWKDEEVMRLREMCESAGVLCIVHWHLAYNCYPNNFQWVRNGPQPRPSPPPPRFHDKSTKLVW